jgi:hypothetical protein
MNSQLHGGLSVRILPPVQVKITYLKGRTWSTDRGSGVTRFLFSKILARIQSVKHANNGVAKQRLIGRCKWVFSLSLTIFYIFLGANRGFFRWASRL